MVAIFLLAAASALPVPPQPPMPGLITPEDYPADALRGEKQGAVLFNLFVDPRGKALNCAVETVYDADFSRLVCQKVLQATFRPATDREGKPAYGFIRTVANVWLPQAGKETAYPIETLPDLSFWVKPVRGLTERRDVKLAVVVDGKGGIADCAPASEGTDSRLVDAACAQLKSQWTGAQLEYPQGTRMSYVRELTVSFEPEGATP